jgi:Spirocyclase AveC-like
MATSTETYTPSGPRLVGAGSRDVGPPTGRSVLWWGAAGVGFAALQIYVFAAWIASGDAHHVGTGVTPVPTSMKVWADVQQVLFGVALPTLLYVLVIRPKRQHGRVSLEGLLFLAMFFVWWQDPLYNYLTTGFSYNATFLNLGGWAAHIPGWSSPNGRNFAEPLIWDISFYMVVSVLGIIFGARLMRHLQTRWPRLSTGRMLAGMFLLIMVLDFAMEFFWVRIGSYAYAGTISSITIFPSRPYRFPLDEPLLVAPLFLGWLCVYHFRNDRGETFVERGLAQLRVGSGAKTCLRFFALVGVMNLIFLLLNNVWVNAFQIHADAWPRSLQERSYFTHGMCGQGTGYACAGATLPINRSGPTVHIGPAGNMIVPPGTKPPLVVPLEH